MSGAATTCRSFVARAIATAGGAGYSPFAPGTCGSGVGFAIAALVAPVTSLAGFLALTAGITAIGVWAASVADRAWGGHDDQRIVVDEVAGTLITVAFVDRSSLALLALGLIAFRVFDILKPPPIGWIDRAVPGGVGVMLDDVAAGLLAGLVLFGLGCAGWLDGLS